MDIEISGIRKMDKGNLKAYVDVKFDDEIVVRDFRIIQQAGREPWVSMPVRAWVSQGGERFFAPLIEIDDGLKMRVVDGILEAWREFRNGNTKGNT